jgi:hypothetical protein
MLVLIFLALVNLVLVSTVLILLPKESLLSQKAKKINNIFGKVLLVVLSVLLKILKVNNLPEVPKLSSILRVITSNF